MFARSALAVALCAALALPAAAQDARGLAEQYVQLPSMQQMLTDMTSPEAVMTQLTASLPPGTELSQDKRERLAAVVSEHLGALQPGMQATLIEVAARVFTAEELEAMIAFYGSEQGASIMAKTQPMMADFMGEFAPEMQAAQQAMLPEIMAILMEP